MRLEVVLRAQQLEADQRTAEHRAEQQGREQQHAGQAERADEDVRHRRRLDRLLDDANDDRICRLQQCEHLGPLHR